MFIFSSTDTFNHFQHPVDLVAEWVYKSIYMDLTVFKISFHLIFIKFKLYAKISECNFTQCIWLNSNINQDILCLIDSMPPEILVSLAEDVVPIDEKR